VAGCEENPVLTSLLFIQLIDEFWCILAQSFVIPNVEISNQNLFAKNSSDKFGRWHHHSICCLVSLRANFCGFSYGIFQPSSTMSPSEFLH